MATGWCRTAAAVAAVAALWPGWAWSQNLLANPDFDSSLTGWTPSVVSVGGSVHSGASGSPAPGSANLWAQYVTAFSGAALGQCVAIAAPGQVDLFARFLQTSGFGDRRVEATFHPGAGCTGAGVTVVQDSYGFLPDGWTEIGRLAYTLPAGTQSAWISISVGAEGPPDGVVQVRFDHVRFGPAGTTPVALESFAIE